MNFDKNMLRVIAKNVSEYKQIPESAVIKDILICDILKKLSESEYFDKCIFKGGTSLSKCYPGTIERFSEDIDLTYLPKVDETEKHIERQLKAIEKLLSNGLEVEKIESERSNRNKSSYIYNSALGSEYRIKMEIGSSVRPEPFSVQSVKSYFQEFLEAQPNGAEYIKMYGLTAFKVNTLKIERTFLDKLFAIKRHTIEGTITNKARHLYDIKQLYRNAEVQAFLDDKDTFVNLVKLVKNTDEAYLSGKRQCDFYNPCEAYNYDGWKEKLSDKKLRRLYETLHEELLYTNERQSFDEVLDIMGRISNIFKAVEE